MPDIFPLELIPEIMESPENFRVQRRVPKFWAGETFSESRGESQSEAFVAFMDLETTGLDKARDKVIQIAIITAYCDRQTGNILRISDHCTMFEDPGAPLPENIKSLTGISDSDLKGQSFDAGKIERILNGQPLVLAHNASFDRPFFDRRFPKCKALQWGCTLKDPDWQKAGFRSHALEQLLSSSGYFYTGHNAMTDVGATVWLMHLHPGQMLELLNKAESGIAVIDAIGSPFQQKDALRLRGYRWNAGNRYWSREISVAQIDREKTFLNGLYKNGGERARITPQDASERFR